MLHCMCDVTHFLFWCQSYNTIGSSRCTIIHSLSSSSCCNTLQHTATKHTATYCNTTHCDTLQHKPSPIPSSYAVSPDPSLSWPFPHYPTHHLHFHHTQSTSDSSDTHIASSPRSTSTSATTTPRPHPAPSRPDHPELDFSPDVSPQPPLHPG